MRLWKKSEDEGSQNRLLDQWGLDAKSLGEEFRRFLSEYLGYSIIAFDLEWKSSQAVLRLPRDLSGGSDHRFHLEVDDRKVPFIFNGLLGGYKFRLDSPAPSSGGFRNFPVKKSTYSPESRRKYVLLPKEEVQALEERAKALFSEIDPEVQPRRASLEPGDPLYEEVWNRLKEVRRYRIRVLRDILPHLQQKLLKKPFEQAELVRAAYHWNVLLKDFFESLRDSGLGIPFFWTYWDALEREDLFPRLEARHVFIPAEGAMTAYFYPEKEPGSDRRVPRLTFLYISGLDVRLELK